MKTWTPLWSSILDSTVWSESKEVRILWITMLAMKDANGVVESSLVGLARRAQLSEEETRAAIKVLESPDQRSDRNQQHEGRRIEKTEVGWTVLNHLKYRDEMSKMRQRHRQKEWQAQYRAKKRGKPLPGEIRNERMQEAGATPAEVARHADSFNRDEEGPL